MRPPWQPMETRGSKPPSIFTITQLRHAHELIDFSGQGTGMEMGAAAPHGQGLVVTATAALMSSLEWLQRYNLFSLGLTMQALVDLGKIVIGDPMDPKKAEEKRLQFSASDTDIFEFRVHSAIDQYTKRIKWLFQGSRRAFGLFQGKNIGIIMDCSEANLAMERVSNFQQMLLHLVDEQMADKTNLYVVVYGTQAQPLWQKVMPVNFRTLEELKILAQSVRPLGSSNLMHGLKLVAPRLKQLDTLVLVVGSLPDQNVEVLQDYLSQILCGRNTVLHCVSYDCSNFYVNQFLKDAVENRTKWEQSEVKPQVSPRKPGPGEAPSTAPPTGPLAGLSNVHKMGGELARLHVYSTTSENEFYASTDVRLILEEIQRAQELLKQVEQLRQGIFLVHFICLLSIRLMHLAFRISINMQLNILRKEIFFIIFVRNRGQAYG